jgi:hypothetical protein
VTNVRAALRSSRRAIRSMLCLTHFSHLSKKVLIAEDYPIVAGEHWACLNCVHFYANNWTSMAASS